MPTLGRKLKILTSKTFKVLIADDSAFIRKILKDILKEIGFFNFLEAKNGKEALKIYKKEKPDLILLDIIMPILSGLDFLKKIKKEDVKKVIVVSVVKDKIRRKKAKEIGVKHYISKPFRKESLLKEVNKILKRK